MSARANAAAGGSLAPRFLDHLHLAGSNGLTYGGWGWVGGMITYLGLAVGGMIADSNGLTCGGWGGGG